MGFFGGWGLALDAIARPSARHEVGILSPWADSSHLSPVFAAAELLGLTDGVEVPLTPLDALKVPSIAKGRAILHSLIASAPLRALNNDGTPVDPQHSWLYRSDSGVSPRTRTAQIIDDHIFHEASLLAVRRGAKDVILDAARIPYDEWTVNEDNEIEVRGTVVDESQVVYIPGPGPGLLTLAGDTIRAARDMDSAWMNRVRNPLPAMVLHEVEEGSMTQAEVSAYVQAVAAARRNLDNAVMFIPAKMNLEVHAAEATDLYETGRNALRLDVANFLNIPAPLLDGSVSAASLTYSTQEGRRNELFDYTIPYWAEPIEQALSLDNVVPRGQRVRFDFTNLLAQTAAPTGSPTKD